MFCGPKFGMLRRGGGLTPDALTPAIIAALTAEAQPTLMWLGKNPSGADELVVGTDDLADLGTPTKQVADAILGGTTTEFTGNSGDRMIAASNAVADITTNTITMMWIGRFLGFANLGAFAGKRDPAAQGWTLLANTFGHVSWTCDGPGSIVTRAIAVNHGTANAQVILCTRSGVNNVQSLWSREGSSEGTRVSETLTSAIPFTIGLGRQVAAFQRTSACMLWIGTDGDFSAFETSRAAVAQALGYE